MFEAILDKRQGQISKDVFAKEYSKFKGGSDRDFTNYLNKKYKTNLSVGAVETRRRRAGIATKNPRNIGDTAGFRKEINRFKGSERYKGFVKDLADKYNIDRKTADTIISQERPDIKELPNKKPEYLIKTEKAKEATKLKNKNYLSDEAIKKEYKLFKPKVSGTDKEFLEHLNKKGYKAFGNKPLTTETIATKRQRLGLESKALTGTGQRFTNKFIKEEAKRLNVSTRGTPAQLRKRVLRKRGEESYARKFGEQALLELKRTKAKERLERIKADPKRFKALRESQRRYSQKRFFGMVPTELNPKGLLYRDLVENALRYQNGTLQNSHIKFKNPNQKKPTSIPKTKDIKLIDTNIVDPKTKKPKVITYDNVLKHIDDTKNIYGTDSKKTLGEYEKKRFIQQNPDLRDQLNQKLNKSYDPSSLNKRAVFSPFHIHHTAGRGQNAFNVQFATASDNMKENALRRKFDSNYKVAKTLSQKKQAVKQYLDAVPNTLEVRLKKTSYGTRPVLVDQLKAMGAKLTPEIRQAAVTLGANPFFNNPITRKIVAGATGIGLPLYMTYDVASRLEQGKGPIQALEEGIIGTEIAKAINEYRALSPEGRAARSIVKQTQATEDPLYGSFFTGASQQELEKAQETYNMELAKAQQQIQQEQQQRARRIKEQGLGAFEDIYGP